MNQELTGVLSRDVRKSFREVLLRKSLEQIAGFVKRCTGDSHREFFYAFMNDSEKYGLEYISEILGDPSYVIVSDIKDNNSMTRELFGKKTDDKPYIVPVYAGWFCACGGPNHSSTEITEALKRGPVLEFVSGFNCGERDIREKVENKSTFREKAEFLTEWFLPKGKLGIPKKLESELYCIPLLDADFPPGLEVDD